LTSAKFSNDDVDKLASALLRCIGIARLQTIMMNPQSRSLIHLDDLQESAVTIADIDENAGAVRAVLETFTYPVSQYCFAEAILKLHNGICKGKLLYSPGGDRKTRHGDIAKAATTEAKKLKKAVRKVRHLAKRFPKTGGLLDLKKLCHTDDGEECDDDEDDDAGDQQPAAAWWPTIDDDEDTQVYDWMSCPALQTGTGSSDKSLVMSGAAVRDDAGDAAVVTTTDGAMAADTASEGAGGPAVDTTTDGAMDADTAAEGDGDRLSERMIERVSACVWVEAGLGLQVWS
jgi:hypothetical protein